MLKKFILSIIFTSVIAFISFDVFKQPVVETGILSAIAFVSLMIVSLLSNNSKEENITDNEVNEDEITLLKKKLEQMTQRANKFETDIKTTELFLASMSHELRTPLNGIIGITEVLDDTKLDKEQKEFVSMIRESSNNLRVIVNDILDVSKLNAGKMELESIEFDLFGKLEASAGVFITKMEEKDIILNLYTDPKIPQFVVGDPTRLSQVVINLVSNAVKFTQRGGHIDVYAKYIKSSNGKVTFKVSVKDSGVGLSKLQQQRIFEPYTQADASTTRKAGGTGLGLTISSKIMEAMGSKLKVKSKEGEGAEFFFTLTLPISRENEFRKEIFENLKVGLSLSTSNPNSKWKDILGSYLKYLGAKSVDCESLRLDKDVDVLIVEHDNITDDNLPNLKGINAKTVLSISSNEQSTIGKEREVFDSIVYRPITLEKLVEIIEIQDTKEDKAEEVATSEEQSSNKLEDLQILVAEDNAINQKLIMAVLNNLGLNVTIANNGEEAVALRKENDYDMIFMDIQMPVMGGVEATHKILEYEKENGLKHIPIIALTANALAGDREKYMSEGMDDYTTKPLNIKDIEELIYRFCDIKE